ncbi:hypothetical protein ACTFIY_001755 [Dictyostelium cf. discoideum]
MCTNTYTYVYIVVACVKLIPNQYAKNSKLKLDFNFIKVKIIHKQFLIPLLFPLFVYDGGIRIIQQFDHRNNILLLTFLIYEDTLKEEQKEQNEEILKDIEKLMIIIYSNISLVYLNEYESLKSLENSEKGISIDKRGNYKNNSKIYFRHSRGKRDLCLLDDALKSIEEAISIESNENFKKEYQEDKEKIEKKIRKTQEEEKQFHGKMKKDEKQFQQFPNVSFVWKPNKGRTVQANTDLPKGSTVFRCAPFASSIEDSDKLATEKYCGFCLQRIAKSDRKQCLCKSCKLYSICKSCRSINDSDDGSGIILNYHKDVCDFYKVLSKYHPGSDTRDMRLMLRIIANIANGKQGKQSLSNPTVYCGKQSIERPYIVDDYQDFIGLTSTLDKVDKEHMIKFKRGVSSIYSLISSVRGNGYLKDFTSRELLECFSSVLTNAHQFSYATSKDIGRGVCPTGSYFNHSCMPNTSWSLDDQGMLLFSTCSNVKKGDELSLGYLANEYPLKNRRQELLDGYYFFCQCPLCEFQSNLSGYLCEKCKEPLLNDSIIYHEPSLTNPLDTGIGLVCSKCSHLRIIESKEMSVKEKSLPEDIDQLQDKLGKAMDIDSPDNQDERTFNKIKHLRKMIDFRQQSIEFRKMFSSEQFSNILQEGVPEQLQSVFNYDASDNEELQQIIEISERIIKSLPLVNGEPIHFYPLTDTNYYEYFKEFKNSKISSPEELQRIKDKILSLINPIIYNSFKDKIDKRLLI